MSNIKLSEMTEVSSLNETDLLMIINDSQNKKTTINTLLEMFMLKAHPIGEIYCSANSTNPAILFGGTWEQIKDKFILACGDTYEARTTGGEATHILTIDEMPEHNHNFNKSNVAIMASSGNNELSQTLGNRTYEILSVANSGGNQAHNNMPPYITEYVWRRIA